jgi:hypothetical protein
MKDRLKRKLPILLMLCVILLAGCKRSLSTPNGPLPTQSVAPDAVKIGSVKVTQGGSIEVDGKADLPDGACVETMLMENEQAVEWWPKDVCIQPDGGDWQMVVPLGRNGAPQNLNSQNNYEMRAWRPDESAKTLTAFPFELTSP